MSNQTTQGSYGGPPSHQGAVQTMPGAVGDEEADRFVPGQGGKVNWDDIPNDDPENPPPVDQDAYKQFEGYEQVGDYDQEAALGPPPPSLVYSPPPEAPHMEFKNTAELSVEESRTAMLEYVAQQCCYGKGCAEQMDIKNIAPSIALHYKLESYCEGRSTCRKFKPYKGGYVDGPENGVPPHPWMIECLPDKLFDKQKKELEVPHTSEVRNCHRCHGRGFLRCSHCWGCGQITCVSCGGDGRQTRHDAEGHSQTVPCGSCGGDGRRRCFTCGGDGRVTCPVCHGYRRLRHFILLTVKFKTHDDDHVIEETDMPDKLVEDVGGIVIFEQTLPMVFPITAYPVGQINERSIAFVELHQTKWPDKRILQQRQTLKAVPVTEVAYKWKDVNTRFWVYGTSREVYAPDYPQQCCWGCQIL